MTGHIKMLYRQLKASASRIEALEAGITTSESSHHIRILKAKYAAAQDKLNELKDAGNKNWEHHKADIWIAWNELENAFRDTQQSAQTEKK